MCERFTRTFPGIPASVARARAWVTEVLSPRISDGEAIGDAQLVVSELVTNALQHTSSGDSGMGRAEARLRAILGRVQLRLLLAPRRIRVEVTDSGTLPRPDGPAQPGDSRDDAGSPGPMVRSPEPDAENGRGLVLVDHLAQRWFWRGSATGRTVPRIWPTSPPRPPPAPAACPPNGTDPRTAQHPIRVVKRTPHGPDPCPGQATPPPESPSSPGFPARPGWPRGGYGNSGPPPHDRGQHKPMGVRKSRWG